MSLQVYQHEKSKLLERRPEEIQHEFSNQHYYMSDMILFCGSCQCECIKFFFLPRGNGHRAQIRRRSFGPDDV